jgi:hypothetical protein
VATLEYGTYSFLDVQATLTGPGGSFDLASNGLAEEGLKYSMIGPKDIMTMGANGNGMHTLVGSNGARVEMSFLKTAPANAVLNHLYTYQSSSSAYWGQNQLTINNPITGDSVTLLGGSFEKQADNAYAMQANLLIWPFLFITRLDKLGNGGNPRSLIVNPAA